MAPIPVSRAPHKRGKRPAPSSARVPAVPAKPDDAEVPRAERKPQPKGRVPVRIPRGLIPGYELERWLGEGTMGAVFKGRQISLDRPVAIKVLTPHLAQNDKFLARFQREARAVAKLNHPNVVSGIDVGEAQGYRYFVMEFVEGRTVAELVAHHGKLDPMEAARIVRQVAEALDHAHRNGMVHRDVKPANIIIASKTGAAKLCDLGLAKEVGEDGSDTLEGRAFGTPLYISPEQARGDRGIDIRSDIYSLGATFFEAVAGRPPFEGTNPPVVMTKHLNEPLPSLAALVPGVPPGVVAVIERMMEKDREDRYQSPEELIADLDLVLSGKWKPEPAGPVIRRRRRARRRFR